MTTAMFRPCANFLFERTMKIIIFLKERERKNENIWDDHIFSAPRNHALDLFDLRQLRSI